ncbi:MAG: Rrf2 family transcriptional regulator [bacterium]|nr:Rrf2 family transcriptional regulator [bacterium]
MKISTKGIYAIEMMTDLAIHSVDSVESIKNIAARRDLSEKYLEQIVSALKKAHLIESTRGASGGYRLAKPANEIKIYDILEATERNLIPIECLQTKTECGINCEKCATRGMWGKLWLEMKQVMDDVTLEQIVIESERNEKEDSIEYYI